MIPSSRLEHGRQRIFRVRAAVVCGRAHHRCGLPGRSRPVRVDTPARLVLDSPCSW